MVGGGRSFLCFLKKNNKKVKVNASHTSPPPPMYVYLLHTHEGLEVMELVGHGLVGHGSDARAEDERRRRREEEASGGRKGAYGLEEGGGGEEESEWGVRVAFSIFFFFLERKNLSVCYPPFLTSD